jgi:hypothetical protein
MPFRVGHELAYSIAGPRRNDEKPDNTLTDKNESLMASEKTTENEGG